MLAESASQKLRHFGLSARISADTTERIFVKTDIGVFYENL
jgi:hypothetical protein